MKTIGDIIKYFKNNKENDILIIFLGISITIIEIYLIIDEELNYLSILCNIAVSFIAAFIFYVFQTVVPSIIKNRKASKAFKDKIIFLSFMMNIAIIAVDKYVKYENGKVKILWDKYSDNELIYLKILSNEDTTPNYYVITKNDIYSLDNIFKNKINEMRISKYYLYLDEQIVDLIETITDIKLFKNIKAIYDVKNTTVNIDILLNEIKNESKYYKDINKLYNLNIDYSLDDVNEKEKVLVEGGINLKENFKDNQIFNEKMEEADIKDNLIKLFKDSDVEPSIENINKCFNAVKDLKSKIEKENRKKRK